MTSPAPDQDFVFTSLSCYNRRMGYYADPESDCKIYHFCVLGDYNGQEVYKRISNLCPNEELKSRLTSCA